MVPFQRYKYMYNLNICMYVLGTNTVCTFKAVVLNLRAACGPSRIQMRPTMLNIILKLLSVLQFILDFTLI